MKMFILILILVCVSKTGVYAQHVVNEGKVWIIEITKDGQSISDVNIHKISFTITLSKKELELNGLLQNIYLENGKLFIVIPFEQINTIVPIKDSDTLELTVVLNEGQGWTKTQRFCPVNGWRYVENCGLEGIELQEVEIPVLSVLSRMGKERSAANSFVATVFNVPVDFLNKGYRIDWGTDEITTGSVRGAGPYEVTGHIGEGFEAPAGEMKVRLLKDTSTVAEANLLPRSGVISVADKEVCYGLKGEKIVANVTAWEPGYFIRWLDNSYHDEPRLVVINDTEAEIRGDFPVGTHTLWAWLFDGTGDIVATTRFTLTVKQGPIARIVTKNLCVSKGETFVLTAEASEDCYYGWSYGSIRSALLDLTINGVMGDYPLQYIFTATDKISGCVARDTAIVSPGPAAPQVSIDTNTNRLDIKIHWTPVADATAYHVYSRKWDPYSLTSENGGSYTKTVVTNTSYIRSAANVASDTLAFFYVKATNGTCESSASDTVGYKLDSLLRDPNNDLSSQNIIVAFFDFQKMGIPTTKEFLLKYAPDISFVRYWDFMAQDWQFSYIEEGEIFGQFTITSGLVLQIELVNPVKLLQYGKLPKPVEFELKNNNNLNLKNNIVFLQPYRADLLRASDVFKEIEKLSFLRKWDFNLQDWIFSYIEEEEVIRDFRLRPILVPLQIELQNSVIGPVKWK